MSTSIILFTPSQDALETARWLTNDWNDDEVDHVYERVASVFRENEYGNGAIVIGLLYHLCEVIDYADRECRKDLYEAVMYLLALCADKDITTLH